LFAKKRALQSKTDRNYFSLRPSNFHFVDEIEMMTQLLTRVCKNQNMRAFTMVNLYNSLITNHANLEKSNEKHSISLYSLSFIRFTPNCLILRKLELNFVWLTWCRVGSSFGHIYTVPKITFVLWFHFSKQPCHSNKFCLVELVLKAQLTRVLDNAMRLKRGCVADFCRFIMCVKIKTNKNLWLFAFNCEITSTGIKYTQVQIDNRAKWGKKMVPRERKVTPSPLAVQGLLSFYCRYLIFWMT